MSRLRIRTIKPDAWTDEAISGVSRDARLLFVVLITFADDDGRFRDLPAQIIGHGYAEDPDVTAKKISGWMSELDAAGVIVRYEVAGKRYATFPKWHLHQRVNRWTKSSLPRCPRRGGVVIPRHDKDTDSSQPHDKLTEDAVSTHDIPLHVLTEDSSPDRECGVWSVEGSVECGGFTAAVDQVEEEGAGASAHPGIEGRAA